jgi:hypothetical protein
LDQPSASHHDLLIFECYPWHSTKITAPMKPSAPSRAVRVYTLPCGQRLIVEWHAGGAGPPNAAETALLRKALM